MTAYTDPRCKEWLDSLNDYIYNNYLTAKDLFSKLLPSATITPQEGTYLMWVNFHSLINNAHNAEHAMISDAKVWINAGTLYGDDGEHCMRINLATQRENVVEGVKRVCGYFAR